MYYIQIPSTYIVCETSFACSSNRGLMRRRLAGAKALFMNIDTSLPARPRPAERIIYRGDTHSGAFAHMPT